MATASVSLTILPPSIPNPPSQNVPSQPSFLPPSTSIVNPTTNIVNPNVQTLEFYEMQMLERVTNNLTQIRIKQDAQDLRNDQSQNLQRQRLELSK